MVLYRLVARARNGALRPQLAVLGLALALSGTAACGDDSKASGDGDGDGAGDGSGDADGDGDGEGTETFEGVVVDSTNITVTRSDHETFLFDTQTGEIDDASKQVSDAAGRVTFEGRDEESTGVYVKSNGVDTQDTWNYPPSRTGEEELLRVGSVTAAQFVPAATEYTTDQESSPVAGSVLWMNPDSGEHEFVGCATIVENDEIRDVRFFENELPTPLANRGLDEGTVPPDGNGGNDQEAGKYFIGNVKGGKVQTLTAKIGDQEIGTVTLYIVPRSEGTPIPTGNGDTVPSNLTLANIIVNDDITENPTPADCQ